MCLEYQSQVRQGQGYGLNRRFSSFPLQLCHVTFNEDNLKFSSFSQKSWEYQIFELKESSPNPLNLLY